MRQRFQNIGQIFFLCLSIMLSSCVADDYEQTAEEKGDINRDVVSIQFGVSTGSYASTRATEEATEYETTITQWRVFLYDTDNYFIGEIDDCKEYESTKDGVDGVYKGTFDSGALAQYDNIKVVFCGNWPRLTSPPAAGSTIDDLCGATMSAYNRFTTAYDHEFVLERAGTYCPYYGVYEYDDITSYKSGDAIEFTETIPLLRAYAKIEVTFEDYDLAQRAGVCDIVNFSTEGVCAPAGVYHQDDYKDGYVNTLNVGEVMYAKEWYMYDVDDGVELVYYGYVGEYDNMGSDYCYLEFPYYTTIRGERKDIKLYFASYTNGVTTAYSDDEPADMPDRLNIQRNKLYRFHISSEPTYDEPVAVLLDVLPWETTEYEVVFEESEHTIY